MHNDLNHLINGHVESCKLSYRNHPLLDDFFGEYRESNVHNEVNKDNDSQPALPRASSIAHIFLVVTFFEPTSNWVESEKNKDSERCYSRNEKRVR